jgi:hypothetical protein
VAGCCRFALRTSSPFDSILDARNLLIRDFSLLSADRDSRVVA